MLKNKLKNWAELKRKINNYFYQNNVLEVNTAILNKYPVTDVYIDSLSLIANKNINCKQKYYLHTSPEIAMKQLIAKGSGDIYQICPAFRDNEYGEYNQNEFSLLEWYRIGFDIHKLMLEVGKLVFLFMPKQQIIKLTYNEVFLKFANINILNNSLSELQSIANKLNLNTDINDIANLQMLLFVHLIEPKLKNIPVCFIYNYPKQQSALAIIENNTSKRFELYIYGVEIANGYQELQTAKEYSQRFKVELNKRKQLNKQQLAIDVDFLDAIKNDLPKVSGVAFGLSRFFYLLQNKYND